MRVSQPSSNRLSIREPLREATVSGGTIGSVVLALALMLTLVSGGVYSASFSRAQFTLRFFFPF